MLYRGHLKQIFWPTDVIGWLSIPDQGDYFDLDGDDESGTIITWFKDSVEQGEFANQLTIPSSATLCDEVWYAEVTPSDGELFGQPINSNTVTIWEPVRYQ